GPGAAQLRRMGRRGREGEGQRGRRRRIRLGPPSRQLLPGPWLRRHDGRAGAVVAAGCGVRRRARGWRGMSLRDVPDYLRDPDPTPTTPRLWVTEDGVGNVGIFYGDNVVAYPWNGTTRAGWDA